MEDATNHRKARRDSGAGPGLRQSHSASSVKATDGVVGGFGAPLLLNSPRAC